MNVTTQHPVWSRVSWQETAAVEEGAEAQEEIDKALAWVIPVLL